ncbi:hypothetical protein D3C76_1769450 [compost metagenome]
MKPVIFIFSSDLISPSAAEISAHALATASMKVRFLNLATSVVSVSRAFVALVFSHSSMCSP